MTENKTPSAIETTGEKTPVPEINFQDEIGKMDLTSGLKIAFGGAWGDGVFTDEAVLAAARSLEGAPKPVQDNVENALLAIGPGMGEIAQNVLGRAVDSGEITQEQMWDVTDLKGQALIDAAKELFKDNPKRLDQIAKIEDDMQSKIKLFGVSFDFGKPQALPSNT